MKLENVTAKIRPRARWESIDLGCAMARRHFGSIMSAWLLTVVPFWLIFILLTGTFISSGWHLFFSLLWCWGTLSIADRVPLLILSRSLFGEKVSVWQVTQLWWTKLWYQQFFRRICARFSYNRGLSLPVSELEGLKGSDYKSRVSLLARNGGDGVTQATMVSLLLVVLTMGTCYMFLMMVYMLYGEADVLAMLIDDLDRHGEEYSIYWLMLLFYLLSLSFLEPFFVGASFAIYVNSRTVTEGWDIELAFKCLNDRVQSIYHKSSRNVLAIALSLGTMLSFLFTSPAQAQDSRIDDIMRSDDFTVHRSYYYDQKADDKHSSVHSFFHIGNVLEGFMLFVFWCIVIAVVGWVIWLIYKNSYALEKELRTKATDDEVLRVKSFMGMDVMPESLPKEIHEEASKAWKRGEHQLAMSLLYRGAISWMVNRAAIPIVESDTERDCVRRVFSGNERASGHGQYFSNLTNSWIKLAYGKRLPSDEDVMRFCDQWPFRTEGFSTGKKGEQV